MVYGKTSDTGKRGTVPLKMACAAIEIIVPSHSTPSLLSGC